MSGDPKTPRMSDTTREPMGDKRLTAEELAEIREDIARAKEWWTAILEPEHAKREMWIRRKEAAVRVTTLAPERLTRLLDEVERLANEVGTWSNEWSRTADIANEYRDMFEALEEVYEGTKAQRDRFARALDEGCDCPFSNKHGYSSDPTDRCSSCRATDEARQLLNNTEDTK